MLKFNIVKIKMRLKSQDHILLKKIIVLKKQKLTDTDKGMVVTKGYNGGQIYGDGRFDFG